MNFSATVIGVDEAGRGPIAGPVVVGAVRLPRMIAGLNDSKQLTPAQRAALRTEIESEAQWAVVFVEVTEIDRHNILQATFRGMERAVAQLALDNPVLIDGNQIPPGLLGRSTAVVKGDAHEAAIAAASILAKEHRDEHMIRLHDEFPAYGFDQHFGYFTPEHRAALMEHGPCAIHRRSFEPVQTMLLQPCLMLD
ncbi:MAG: ribonuclease HII [Chthonomonas sp.]|nr:ribonuclease HII [Chthonomonas sp.]